VAAGLTPAAQGQLPQPTFRTEANYVRVDVYPTRDGAPVTDLTAADFEVVEDKIPQRVEQFEHIVIRSAAGQDGRPEPHTVAESLAAIQDPRTRVFVLFLDRMHVDLVASRQIGRPMIDTLNRLIGPDDYVATMMTGMSARDITFARRTTSIETVLKRDWWGGRDRMIFDDPIEKLYAYCYPGVPNPGQATASDQGIAQEMILRRREQQTLDALEDLVVYLRGVREERKAVLAITDGWLLYQPNSNLIRPIDNTPPTIPAIGVDPRNGRLTTKNTQNPAAADVQVCERDRLALSQIDDEPRFRTILDEANRANASFYPIDPRGLVVFDSDIVPAAGVGAGPNANPTLTPGQDRAQLMARVTSLRRLAEGTDGTAVVATNNIFPALRRITDDLSSYYLLGYYSTGKLDGRFHAITVRVKRPGVSVRARRGYQAPRLADLANAALPPPTPAAPSAEMAIAASAASAVAHMTGSVRDLPLRVHVTAGWRAGADGRPAAAFWTVGEVVDRIPGADLEAVLTTGAGEIVTTGRGRIVPGTTSALVALVPGQGVEPGDYVIRVRSQSPTGTETLSMPVTLPPASQSSGAVFIRRLTGNKEMATADVRFRRSERVRVEVPSASDATGARLLDRTGKPLAVPVVAATRTDADGTRWATGELALAPLGPGDYVIEVLAGSTRTLVAFRLVP
jgi:VWFA-related protein